MTQFLDASFLFAVFCKDDSFHQQARKVIESINQRSDKVITSDISLSETINLVFRLKGPSEVNKFLKYFTKTKTEITYIDKETFQSGYKILLDQKSKRGLNFFDCLHLATMKQLGIKNILTFDDDFKNYVKINEVN